DGGEGSIVDAVDEKDPSRLTMLHHGDAADGPHRTDAAVVGKLVARLQALQTAAGPPHQDRSDDAVPRKERTFRDVVRGGGELADPGVGAGLVLPDQERRVQPERLPEQIERKKDGLMDLFDARPREPLVFAGARGLARRR